MSTVVRKGIIELELRAVKARLESPQIDAAARAYKEVEKATHETAKAQQEVVKETVQATKATQEFGIKSLVAFREAGEGAFRLMRGLTLLSASGSDDMKRLIQNVALAQGAFDAFAGGLKIFSNLRSVMGGPVTLAITGVTAAISAGVVAWSRWRGEAERSAKALQDAMKVTRERIKATEEAANALADRFASAVSGFGNIRDQIRDLMVESEFTPEGRAAAEARAAASRESEMFRTSRAMEDMLQRLRRQRPGAAAMLDFQGASAIQQLGLIPSSEADRKRLIGLADRQKELLESQFKFQKDQAAKAQAAAFGQMTGLFSGAALPIGFGQPFGGLAPGVAAAGPMQEIARQNEAAAQSATESLQTIARGIEGMARLIEKLEDRLAAAHPH
jgi:hypothetical protein